MTNILLALHIVAGSIALLSMVVPMVSKKGGVWHRRFGWAFVGGMTIVSVTALGLSGIRFLTDASPRGQFAGAFLFYIAILTGAGVSAGVRVLGAKTRVTGHRNPWDLGIEVLLVVSSVAAAVYGVVARQPLFIGFSVIGLIGGGSRLAYWLRPPSNRMHWWFQHMGAMLGSCIAAVTAFLVVNADNLGASTFAIALWLGPSVVGGPAIAIWTAYYRRKFAGSTRARAVAAVA